MVKLIASDLDGTLLQNGARDVNPIVFDQIRTLKEHGIMFAAASGRQYLNLRRLFTPVQDDIAYIAENGSLCIYNEETISKGIIEQDLAYRILDEVARYPQYNCIISGERVCYSTSKNPEFYNHMVNVIKNHMKFIDDPKSEIPEPILKIAVCDYNGTDACEKHLKEMFSSDIKVVTSGNLWVDFICPTANKGSALKNLLDHLHIDAKDCVVFGDQYNDVECSRPPAQAMLWLMPPLGSINMQPMLRILLRKFCSRLLMNCLLYNTKKSSSCFSCMSESKKPMEIAVISYSIGFLTYFLTPDYFQSNIYLWNSTDRFASASSSASLAPRLISLQILISDPT